jgi:metallophosphoesterase superfamily enzyme
MPCTAPRPPRLQIRPDAWLDARLALWLATTRALVVADLHWGYAESHRAHGNLLPAWGDADIAARLRGLIADYQPAEMIWLGDSLHTLAGRSAAETFLLESAVPVTILAGNHDARWSRAQELRTVTRGGYFLHHGDQSPAFPDGQVEIVGHHHPAFVWHDGAGTHLKLPALVASDSRLVLPAFSPWAAGSPWPERSGEVVYAIGTKRIFTVSPGARHNLPDAR